MNWLAMALMTLQKLPVEKLFIKRSDPMDQVKKLEALFAKDTKEGQSLQGKANEVDIRPETKQPSPVSDAETIAYQKREVGKEIMLLEKHLQQKCKILGKACDCCEKHLLPIEGLAQETLGMTGEPVYTELVSWVKSIALITTPAASASGEHDDEYPQLAVKAREFRKRIIGTDEIKALLTPGLSEKVSADLQKILDKALKPEGGRDGESGTEDTV